MIACEALEANVQEAEVREFTDCDALFRYRKVLVYVRGGVCRELCRVNLTIILDKCSVQIQSSYKLI
jgi:hypothetical protein